MISSSIQEKGFSPLKCWEKEKGGRIHTTLILRGDGDVILHHRAVVELTPALVGWGGDLCGSGVNGGCWDWRHFFWVWWIGSKRRSFGSVDYETVAG